MKFKNDIGKPWRFEEDGLTVTRSSVWSPPGCHPTSCGVKFYVDAAGNLVKVEGDENNPVTHGRLCARCLALRDYIYNPSRVIYPMKRARENRGKNEWERVGWNEALDLIEEKVKYFHETYGPECILGIGGTGRDGGIEIQEYCHSCLGTPNAAYTQSGYACYIPRRTATAYIIGGAYPEMDYAGGLEGTYDNPEYVLPELLVLWGKEPLPSNPDGLFGHAIIDLMKRGTKIVSVDPRVNWLSTRAVKRLRLRPGTDPALAMAMLNVIVSENLYDHDFVDKWCYGFDEMAERVKEMTPERAAEICDLDAQDIVDVARMYANAKPAAILWGLAIDQNPNGMQGGQSIISLMAICGNLDVPGGIMMQGAKTTVTQNSEARMGWESMNEELRSKIIGLKEYPAYITMILNAQADSVLDTLESGEPYRFRMLFVAGSNPLAPTNSAQPKRWHAALSKLEWGFGVDCFITPTIQACCDLILPLSTVAEHNAFTYPYYGGLPIGIGTMTRVIEVGECKSDQEILYLLGKRLNPELWSCFDSFEDYLDRHRGRGIWKFDEIQKEVFRQSGNTYRKYETGGLRRDGNLGFDTPTGRVELYSTMIEHYGDDPLPYYFEPPMSPVSSPELYEEYPLILTTGARTYVSFHSEHRQIPLLREVNPNPLVEINPTDAVRLGVADGQWVEVYNNLGSARFKAKVSPVVKPGVVMAQHGWWFPEQDGEEPNLFGNWQSNINDLVPHHAIGKLGFGAPYKCGLCNIKPLVENYDVDMARLEEMFSIRKES